MQNKDWTILVALIVVTAFTITLGYSVSKFSESETAKVALKEGYCSKLSHGNILWEKCNGKRQ